MHVIFATYRYRFPHTKRPRFEDLSLFVLKYMDTVTTATEPQHCNPMPADYSPSIVPMLRSGAEPG